MLRLNNKIVMGAKHFAHSIPLNIISSILMIVAAASSIILYNTSLKSFLEEVSLAYDLKFVANEVLMTIFFFLVGMELKKELISGVLRNKAYVTSALLAAIGGMLLPILIFLLINFNNPEVRAGFAIPCATDIAFALGAFNLIPKNTFSYKAKIFLLAIAVFDDIGSILLIASFYSKKLQFQYLSIVIIGLVILMVARKKQQQNFLPYLLGGALLWIGAKLIGVHVTIAGVITGLFLPYNAGYNENPLFNKLFKSLNSGVNLLVLPIFSFVACNIDLSDIKSSFLLNKNFLSVAISLFLGKQIGIIGFMTAAQFCKITSTESRLPFKDMYIVSSLAGIGFTMGLFISELAFPDAQVILSQVKSGLLFASAFAIIWGLIYATLIKLYSRSQIQANYHSLR
jgi:NhaA family Na+:H+ antiporter